jgi:NADPH-dependent 2,4-dienoyl-CoA reductase/sulfur reductase-like enzyme
VTRLVIVGGSDAGVEAALAARRQDPDLDVRLLLDDAYLNYSICGLPFLISGEVGDWNELAHRSAAAIEGEGVGVLPGHRVTGLDLAARRGRGRTAA